MHFGLIRLNLHLEPFLSYRNWRGIGGKGSVLFCFVFNPGLCETDYFTAHNCVWKAAVSFPLHCSVLTSTA